ncbi:MAG: 16S rRNA (guanine(527)-N(7))-methyltransferase RsmG [SAR324 cluster bacterium]|jgi:16S rRNA (guanine527-N7)-methyltransferase|nr:16S rRNA (guanine(527)-N(7))-methyltransferase RsmG [SAR324 cluster bacterium]MDG1487774.1 16S rRNA (guanine(527)-N(7))-methyltransferase RsmG [SAR324 cluster bacterium]MDP6210732.1 16S rRNA (guanine(527)-N(7))-methyltransferase RsmG [SAR324 cluster bacterium]RZO40245.1 MAG: 16S rRNA (guanine(527)-N(7))-methyltransferase RsmG [Pseudomonadota bacterium]|tara:strand:+ start:16 stop:702 length:687 start_codon:yes stop_codon:yes gene_type:complete
MSDYQSPLTAADVRRICLENGLDISDSQWQLLEKWAALLLEVNQNVNLISRKETEFLWEKQILPCLALLIFRKFSPDADVCDFGTGGGLPGMLLAIVRPDLRLTLLDSRHKKIEVVQQMIDSLKLSNAQTVLGRGEELGKQRPWRQRFPLLTARAVAPLIDLVRWTADLRKVESVLHIYKGGEIKDEVFALSKKVSGVRVNKSLMVLKGYPKFAENQKYIISLEFSSK